MIYGETSAEKHQRFLVVLRESDDVRVLVAFWFMESKGYDVRLAHTEYAPARDQASLYSDKGDLYISKPGRPEHRVEVKGLNYDFTSADDYPYRNAFIVISRSKWDRADPKPWAVVIVNRLRTHMAIVMGATRDRWRVDKRTDREFGDTQEYYFAPIECVTFHELPEPRKEK